MQAQLHLPMTTPSKHILSNKTRWKETPSNTTPIFPPYPSKTRKLPQSPPPPSNAPIFSRPNYQATRPPSPSASSPTFTRTTTIPWTAPWPSFFPSNSTANTSTDRRTPAIPHTNIPMPAAQTTPSTITFASPTTLITLTRSSHERSHDPFALHRRSDQARYHRLLNRRL